MKLIHGYTAIVGIVMLLLISHCNANEEDGEAMPEIVNEEDKMPEDIPKEYSEMGIEDELVNLLKHEVCQMWLILSRHKNKRKLEC